MATSAECAAKSSKLKSLLTSFLGGDVQKSNLEERNEGSSVDPTILKSLDRKAYLERVHTFHSLSWFAKPKALSPLHCARFGWRNVDTDILQCESCRAYVSGHLPQARGNTRVYGECCERVLMMLSKGHHTCCSWANNPCPEYFMDVPVGGDEEAVSCFRARLRRLLTLGHKLPRLDAELRQDMGLSASLLEKLAQLISDTTKVSEDGSGDAQQVASAVSHTDDGIEAASAASRQGDGSDAASAASHHAEAKQSAAALALCGWDVKADSLCAVISCECCQREVGLWNFRSLEGDVEDVMENLGLQRILDVETQQYEQFRKENKKSRKRKSSKKTDGKPGKCKKPRRANESKDKGKDSGDDFKILCYKGNVDEETPIETNKQNDSESSQNIKNEGDGFKGNEDDIVEGSQGDENVKQKKYDGKYNSREESDRESDVDNKYDSENQHKKDDGNNAAESMSDSDSSERDFATQRSFRKKKKVPTATLR